MSHGRLVAFIAKYNSSGLCRVYQKKQLQSICEGYGVRVNSRDNKSILSEKLFEAITSNSCIPNISCVDDRQYTIAENIESNDGGIRIRLQFRGKIYNVIYTNKYQGPAACI